MIPFYNTKQAFKKPVFCLEKSEREERLFYDHDDRLRIISEIFTEEIDAALVFGVLFDADVQLYRTPFVQFQIVEFYAVVHEDIIDVHAVFVHGDFL